MKHAPKYIFRDSNGFISTAQNDNERDFTIQNWERRGKSGVMYEMQKMVGSIDFPDQEGVDDIARDGARS